MLKKLARRTAGMGLSFLGRFNQWINGQKETVWLPPTLMLNLFCTVKLPYSEMSVSWWNKQSGTNNFYLTTSQCACKGLKTVHSCCNNIEICGKSANSGLIFTKARLPGAFIWLLLQAHGWIVKQFSKGHRILSYHQNQPFISHWIALSGNTGCMKHTVNQ